MATYIRTSSIRKRILDKKSNIDSFSPVNYKWNCPRVRIYVGGSSRLKSMKKHKCFIPVNPMVFPAR